MTVAAAPSLLSLLGGHWEPLGFLDVLLLGAPAAYCWGLVRLRGRWPAARALAFAGGIAVLALALQSGIDAYDDRLLSVHMVQHMLLLLIAPPLLLAGRPLVLALRALAPARRSAPAALLVRARPLTHPLIGLFAFSAVIGLTHIPAFYEATLRHPALHDAEHLAYLTVGLLFWSPLLEGVPAPRRRLGGLERFFYVLAGMPAMIVIGAYLNRDTTLLYPAYAAPARALAVNPLLDQARAAAIMWVLGGLVMVLLGLYVAMTAMIGEERRLSEREARERVRAVALRGGPSR